MQEKINKAGEAPVYLRITKDRKPKYVSLGLRVKPQEWNPDAAFGEGCAEQVCFPDRVDVRLTQPAPLRYIVFYGNILNLSKTPGFAITLYAPDATREQVVRWQTYLQAQSAAEAAGLAPLPWFGRNIPSLLIGRSYLFTGTKLTELQTQIEEAITKHWKPLEEAWVGLAGPPAALN